MESPEAIIALGNAHERFALGRALTDIGFIVFPCVGFEHAYHIFERHSFDVRLFLFDADSNLQTLHTISRFIETRGYQRCPHLIGLSNRLPAGDLVHQAGLKGYELFSKGDDILHKAKQIYASCVNLEKPEFHLRHTIGSPYAGRCVAGEIFSKLFVRTRRLMSGSGIPLSGKPLVFLDGIFRYSTEDCPLTGEALLRHMELDPVYISAIPEESLNKRNLITNFWRIKEEGLRPILGEDVDEIALSEHVPGGERAYYFRAEVIVRHKEITLPIETV